MSERPNVVLSAQRDATLTKQQMLTVGTIFASVLVLVGAGYVAGLRSYMGSESFAVDPLVYFRAILLGFAVLLCPFVISDRYCQISVGAIFSLLLGLAFLPAPFLFVTEVAASVIVVTGLSQLIKSARLVNTRIGLGVVILALFMGTFLGEINLRHNYSIPIGLECALLGMAHQDTLFHAALAQNLLTTSISSIGADGLVPLVYHIFSHRVIGGFSTLLGTEILHGYAIFLSVVAIPVLIGLLLQTATVLYQPSQIRLDATAALFSVLAWLVFGGAVMWHSYYSSESYTLSLWFVLLVVLLLHHFTKPDVQGLERWSVVFLLALGVGLAALSKVSVGAVLACAVAAGLVAGGRFRPAAWATGIVAGLLPAILIYFAYPVTQDSSATLIKPFAFLRYTKPAVYALLLACVVSFLAWRHFPRDHATRTQMIALCTGLWAGLGASFLVNTAAGAQYYFSDPGSWMGLMLVPLLGLAPKWLTRRGPSAQFAIVAGFISVMLFMHDDNLRGLDRLAGLRVALNELPTSDTLGERAVQHTPTGQMLQIARDRAGDYDVIWIDGAHDAFWKGQDVCWTTSFVLPALVGKPMLQGIIPERFECDISRYYGFADYDLALGRASAGTSGSELCPAAMARGLERILVITAEDSSILNCAN